MVLHNPNNWHWVNKDASPWAKQYLEENIKQLKAEDNGVTVKLDKLISMDGDVDVNQRKGKVITIYDVKLVIEYSGTTNSEESVSGTITVPEVAHDTELHEYVVCLVVPTGDTFPRLIQTQFDIDIYSDATSKAPVKNLVRSTILPQLRKLFAKLGPALIAEHGKYIQHAPGSGPSTGKVDQKPYVSGLTTTNTSIPQSNTGKSVVNTTTVTDTDEFRAPASEIYKTFTDPQRIAAFTRGAPKLFEGSKINAKFELFGGNVAGEYLELVEPSKIVQSWRLDQWPKGHYSRLDIVLDQNDVDCVTVMRVSWTGVPVGQEEVTKRNWKEYYVRSIKQTFGFGTIL